MGLVHAFVSVKPPAPDPTIVDGPKWNDTHRFTGANLGALLYRDAADLIQGLGSATGVLRCTAPGAVPFWDPTIDTTELGYLDGVTPGVVTASKAVVVDANKDIASFRNLTAQTLVGQHGNGVSGLFGADGGATTITNATNKLGRIGTPHYLIAEEPMAALVLDSNATDNRINIGGGSGVFNAATVISFYTAANPTTTTGTRRWDINSAGHFLAVLDNTYDVGSGGANRPRDGHLARNLFVGNTATIDTAVNITPATAINPALTFGPMAANVGSRINFFTSNIVRNWNISTNLQVSGALEIHRTTLDGGTALESTSVWFWNSAGHFLAGVDNTYDIGASGTTRPRNIYAAANAYASAFVLRSTMGYLTAASDGVFGVYNNAGNDFTRIQLGGTTNLFPALRRTGAMLESVLADASDFAGFAASYYAVRPAGSIVATSGDVRVRHTAIGMAGRNSANTANRAIIDWGNTNTDVLTLGDPLNGRTQIIGGDIRFIAPAGVDIQNGLVAQSLRIYSTYTDAGNNQGLTLRFSGAGGEARIQTFALGTGTTTALALGAGAEHWRINSSGHFLAGANNTYDIGGGSTRPRSVYVGTSIGIGTATPGVAAGDVSLGSDAEGLRITHNYTPGDTTIYERYNGGALILGAGNNTAGSWKINQTGHLTGVLDNTYDIGASGATRPRNVYLSDSLTVNSAVKWTASTTITAPSNGVLRLTNTANTDFDRLQFGGTTASFPALRRTSTQLDVVLADGSAFANLQIANLYANAVAISSGSLAVGVNPAATGAIRLPNSTAIYGRNGANTADVHLISSGSDNAVYVGSGTNVSTVYLGFTNLSIRPYDNNTQSLGVSGLHWSNVYATTYRSGNLTGTVVTNDPQTVASGAVISLGTATTAGLLVIAAETANIAVFLINGSTASVALIAQTGVTYTTVAGTASRLNVYWSAANSRYEFQNNFGYGVPIRLMRLGQ